MLSGDGENTNSLQFNGIWIKFNEEGQTLLVQIHQCTFLDTVTARGEQGRVHIGETTRTYRRINKVFNKLMIQDSPIQRDRLMTLASVQHLFPQGVRNFNNLIYNIKSYNKAHFGEDKNFYNERKGFGGKYLDDAFVLGSTGPLLGSLLTSASIVTNAQQIFKGIGSVVDFVNLFTEVSFSKQYENAVNQSSKKRVIILDFDKENDTLRDSTGHVVRAFSRNIISKHNEVIITDENIFQAMYHSVSDYLDGYIKRAKSQM